MVHFSVGTPLTTSQVLQPSFHFSQPFNGFSIGIFVRHLGAYNAEQNFLVHSKIWPFSTLQVLHPSNQDEQYYNPSVFSLSSNFSGSILTSSVAVNFSLQYGVASVLHCFLSQLIILPNSTLQSLQPLFQILHWRRFSFWNSYDSGTVDLTGGKLTAQYSLSFWTQTLVVHVPSVAASVTSHLLHPSYQTKQPAYLILLISVSIAVFS